MKSLLLYDLWVFILPSYVTHIMGYPIASKMKILAMAVASTYVGH